MIKKLLLISCFLVSIFGYSHNNGDFENRIPTDWTQNQTLDDDPGSEITVDCEDEPINTVYCYEAYEEFEMIYTSSNLGNVLNLTVNSGNIYAYGEDFIILDSDGTTELYSGTGVSGDLSDISVQSTGDQITVSYTASFYACGDGAFTALDFDVSCATCVNPQADFTVVEDCENGQQFLIDVDLTDLGSATDVNISDN